MNLSDTFRPQDFDRIWNVCSRSKVFIDTCSLLDEHYPLLEQPLFLALKMAGAQLIIPYRVVEELIRKEKEGPALSARAGYALQSIKKYQEEGLVSLRLEKTDNFADSVFSYVFTTFRMQHDLTLITQDRGLAHDILKLNNIRSEKSAKTIAVYRITKYGTLGRNDGDILQ